MLRLPKAHTVSDGIPYKWLDKTETVFCSHIGPLILPGQHFTQTDRYLEGLPELNFLQDFYIDHHSYIIYEHHFSYNVPRILGVYQKTTRRSSVQSYIKDTKGVGGERPEQKLSVSLVILIFPSCQVQSINPDGRVGTFLTSCYTFKVKAFPLSRSL